MSNELKVDFSSRAVIVRFTRPEIRNSLSITVLEQLEALLDDCGDEIEQLIFTGRNGVFASGADLREIASISIETSREFALRGQSLMTRIATMPQMTVAAINGFCFGGALDLALACDYRIATQDAQFAHPGAGLGIITGWGGTQRLPRLIGDAFALEMFFSALPLTAERAFEIGLIDEIADDLLAAALARDNS